MNNSAQPDEERKSIKGRNVVLSIAGIVLLVVFATVYFSKERERLRAAMQPKTGGEAEEPVHLKRIPKQLRPPSARAN